MPRSLEVQLLTSTDPTVDFDKTSTPLIIAAFEANGHQVTVQSAEAPPTVEVLLAGDVFVDRSPITDPAFFWTLARAVQAQRSAGKALPLLVDNPHATLVASDKRKTHDLFPGLVPESYNLDGIDNEAAFTALQDHSAVVIKDPLGWYSIGTERLSVAEAREKYHGATNRIIQEYIPFARGVGRVLGAHYAGDFELICSYMMVPNDWRTGHGVTTEFELAPCPPELTAFAAHVTKTSGIYLNGLDYIERGPGDYVLLETNTVPNLRVPLYWMGIDAPARFVAHIERSHARLAQE